MGTSYAKTVSVLLMRMGEKQVHLVVTIPCSAHA
jgi:hypothetical protein